MSYKNTVKYRKKYFLQARKLCQRYDDVGHFIISSGGRMRCGKSYLSPKQKTPNVNTIIDTISLISAALQTIFFDDVI